MLYKIWGPHKASKKEWKIIEKWFSINSNCNYVKVFNVNTKEIIEIEEGEVVGGIK